MTQLYSKKEGRGRWWGGDGMGVEVGELDNQTYDAEKCAEN